MRLIDADALINRIVFHSDLSGDQKEVFEDEINAEPSAQPELETVKCIIGESCMDIGDADFSMKCAKCGAEYYHVEYYDYDYNFCPNCGRRWRKQGR